MVAYETKEKYTDSSNDHPSMAWKRMPDEPIMIKDITKRHNMTQYTLGFQSTCSTVDSSPVEDLEGEVRDRAAATDIDTAAAATDPAASLGSGGLVSVARSPSIQGRLFCL